MDRFEMMTCNSERGVNRAADREKSLNLCRRLEATHLAFLLPGVLMGDFSSVVKVHSSISASATQAAILLSSGSARSPARRWGVSSLLHWPWP